MKLKIDKKWSVALLGVALFSVLPSCSLSNDSERKEAKEEMKEALKEEKEGENAQEIQLQDSLKEVDQMVEAVESDTPSSTWQEKYGASFFTNDANASTKPSSDKYVKTASGLKYTIINPGKGANPKATDSVTVHYTGMLSNGTVFDSSIDRGEPTTFPLQAVIPGWTEGLQYMQPGSTAVFYIPSNLAYGERGIPGVIPANAPLIFWVQLISIN